MSIHRYMCSTSTVCSLCVAAIHTLSLGMLHHTTKCVLSQCNQIAQWWLHLCIEAHSTYVWMGFSVCVQVHRAKLIPYMFNLEAVLAKLLVWE